MTDQALFQKYHIEYMPISGPPFGLDDQGQKVGDVGRSIKAATEYMMVCVRHQMAQSLPSDLPPEERRQHIEKSTQVALNHLVEMLNASIRDRRFQVNAEYLLNANNYCSYEFDMVINEYTKAISGDEQFYFNRGVRSIPQAITWITRPFSVAQKYEALPRLVARFVNTDIRVVEVVDNHAIIQWRAKREAELLPEQYRLSYFHMGCEAWKGVCAAIPNVLDNLPMATVRDLHCQRDGDECCELLLVVEVLSQCYPLDMISNH